MIQVLISLILAIALGVLLYSVVGEKSDRSRRACIAMMFSTTGVLSFTVIRHLTKEIAISLFVLSGVSAVFTSLLVKEMLLPTRYIWASTLVSLFTCFVSMMTAADLIEKSDTVALVISLLFATTTAFQIPIIKHIDQNPTPPRR